MRIFIGIVAAALVPPATALGGGWATVGLTPPADVGAGQTWKQELTILQHGRTPLEGVSPTLTISNGKTKKSFAAKPTDKPGVYVAEVVFPSRGKWSYVVDDGFSQTHTFGPITVGAAGGGGAGTTDAATIPLVPIAGGIALVLAAVFALFVLARRLRTRAPAPTH